MNVFCYDGLGIVSNNAADPDPHHFPFLLVLYVKIIKIDINQNSIFRIIILKNKTNNFRESRSYLIDLGPIPHHWFPTD